MSGKSTEAIEMVKYFISVVALIGGSYVAFIIRAIGKDIAQLKEFLMSHIKELKEDIEKQRGSIIDLYEKTNQNGKDIASQAKDIENLKEKKREE